MVASMIKRSPVVVALVVAVGAIGRLIPLLGTTDARVGYVWGRRLSIRLLRAVRAGDAGGIAMIGAVCKTAPSGGVLQVPGSCGSLASAGS